MDVVPLLQLDDARFGKALAVQQRTERSFDPDTPPITEPELRLFAVHDHTDGNRHERFAVVDGDEVRALAHLELEMDDVNAHFCASEIFGAAEDPDAGRVALAALLDVAEADSRTVMVGWGPQSPGEAAFWEGVGAPLQYRERISVLDVPAVDPELMTDWIARRDERAGDIELVRFVDRCPDELLDTWATSRSAMSDAPMEGLDVNDWSMDADDIREDEEARRALGMRMMHLLALAPDGSPCGHTTINVNTFRPMASDQWDTVVLDAHRQRGIGRWLKAEMWRWLREEEPEVTRLGTGNANSNDPMLSINVAMGYVPLVDYGAWQADLPTYRRALASA
ncbi:MAG: hypothetical protein AAF548_08070 [Actinomycetota bacterium]